MSAEPIIRRMLPEDLPFVHALQCKAYPQAYHESPEALKSRLLLGQQLCWAAEYAGQLAGYLLAHPWRGALPELHVPLTACEQPDHVFLHDMAVLPECHGLGLGPAMHARLYANVIKFGFSELRLVAVGNARRFWEKQGYCLFGKSETPSAYGTAALMHLPVFA